LQLTQRLSLEKKVKISPFTIAKCFSGRFCLSHHFDTKLAKEDPSLNLCDFYLFDGPSGKTVMAMTVNPDLGLSAPDTLHPGG
jgi:hypothetical protein